MADVVIHEIQSLGRVETIIGSMIIGLAGVITLKFQTGEYIDPIMLVLIALFIILLVVLQLLYYLKFILEKREFRDDMKVAADCQNETLILQIKRLELERKLKQDG